MDKLKELQNQIIQAYKQAQTIKELEEVREETRLNYNKLVSQKQTRIKDEFKKRMEQLE